MNVVAAGLTSRKMSPLSRDCCFAYAVLYCGALCCAVLCCVAMCCAVLCGAASCVMCCVAGVSCCVVVVIVVVDAAAAVAVAVAVLCVSCLFHRRRALDHFTNKTRLAWQLLG